MERRTRSRGWGAPNCCSSSSVCAPCSSGARWNSWASVCHYPRAMVGGGMQLAVGSGAVGGSCLPSDTTASCCLERLDILPACSTAAWPDWEGCVWIAHACTPVPLHCSPPTPQVHLNRAPELLSLDLLSVRSCPFCLLCLRPSPSACQAKTKSTTCESTPQGDEKIPAGGGGRGAGQGAPPTSVRNHDHSSTKSSQLEVG